MENWTIEAVKAESLKIENLTALIIETVERIDFVVAVEVEIVLQTEKR